MDGSRHLLCTLPLLLLLLSVSRGQSYDYDFWNPASTNVQLPNHFLIDELHGAIIVTAKNSVCHLSLDLKHQYNFHDASPDQTTRDDCVADTFSQEGCQNYHHILLYPGGSRTFTAMGQQYNLTDTVLVCGSNAYSPECHFRERKNLTIVHTEGGVGFCPYRQSPVTSALWTSTSRLISSAPQLPNRVDGVVVSLSNSPYNGEVEVSTVKDSSWLNKSPQFVSMYEIGEYIYMFFREEAVETTRPVLYSRVARVCKNETGAHSPSNDNAIIFTTFLKARIKCSSGSGANGDLPFNFNNLHDTFYLPSGSFDGTTTGQHLYGVFTSSKNGPVGSAVCVFTFDTHSNDLHRVFNGRYLQRRGTTNWVSVPNIPFTCTSRRNASEAERIQLMELPVEQSNGPSPIIQLSGYLFQKITVDSVQAVNGTVYETMFIAAYKNNDVVLLKVTYVPTRTGDKYHISQSIVLTPDPRQPNAVLPEITQLRLFGTGPEAHVYVGTTTGIYRVNTSRCENYTDCCSCVGARDPYCAYNATSQMCEAVSADQRVGSTLVQDVANGDVGQCMRLGTPTSNPTMSATTTVDMMTTATTQEENPTTGNTNSTSTDTSSQSTSQHQASTSQPSPTPTPISQDLPSSPATDALSTQQTTQYDHTWTIVGAVSSFVGGVVLGILLMAVFYNRKNFLWSKYFSDRRSHDNGEKGGAQGYSYRTNTAPDYTTSSKEEEFTKNNWEYNTPLDTPEKPETFQYHPTTENVYCKTPCTPVPHPIPTPHYNPRSAATSPYRSMASKPQSLNLKTNFRAEEHLTNREREVYGKNIVARMPSIDTSSKTSLHLQNGHTHRLPVTFNAHGGGVVQIHDSEIGCSDC